jgi:transcriptional regulator with XRE-family HTH domain
MLQRIDYPRLAAVLLARGYTTASLARELGMTQPSVSRLARGLTRSVRGDVALKLITLAGGSVVAPAVEPAPTDA